MTEMISLPSFLAFLLPLPAARLHSESSHRRRRAISNLGLSRHILRDAGLEDLESASSDTRWVQRPDLER